MEAEQAWTIHITRGRVTLSIRTDEMGANARDELNAVLDAIRDLAWELDRSANTERTDKP